MAPYISLTVGPRSGITKEGRTRRAKVLWDAAGTPSKGRRVMKQEELICGDVTTGDKVRKDTTMKKGTNVWLNKDITTLLKEHRSSR